MSFEKLPGFRDIQIAEGVRLSYCRTEDFKSSLMTVSFVSPLDKETASGYSLLTNMLSLATAGYKTMRDFSTAKDELYALGLDSYVQRRGELLLVTLELSCIADEYTLDGEKLLYKATALLGEAIFSPLLDKDGNFPQSAVESEKVNLINEINSIIENKQAYAVKRAKELLCPDEPFSVDAAGSAEAVEKLTGADLRRYYDKCVNELPVIITYAGSANEEYLRQCVNDHLRFSPRTGKPVPPVTHRFGGLKKIDERLDMEERILVLGFECGLPANIYDRAVLSVFDEIYGGSSTSKLFMNVREKKGLCYYCSSYPSGRKNLFFVVSAVERDSAGQAADAIIKETDAMRRGDFSDGELDQAKKSVIRSLKTMGSGLASLTGYMLGQALLGTEDTFGSIEKNINAIESVTRGDVSALAQRFKLELIYTLG